MFPSHLRNAEAWDFVLWKWPGGHKSIAESKHIYCNFISIHYKLSLPRETDAKPQFASKNLYFRRFLGPVYTFTPIHDRWKLACLPYLQTVPYREPHRHLAPVVLKQFADDKWRWDTRRRRLRFWKEAGLVNWKFLKQLRCKVSFMERLSEVRYFYREFDLFFHSYERSQEWAPNGR